MGNLWHFCFQNSAQLGCESNRWRWNEVSLRCSQGEQDSHWARVSFFVLYGDFPGGYWKIFVAWCMGNLWHFSFPSSAQLAEEQHRWCWSEVSGRFTKDQHHAAGALVSFLFCMEIFQGGAGKLFCFRHGQTLTFLFSFLCTACRATKSVRMEPSLSQMHSRPTPRFKRSSKFLVLYGYFPGVLEEVVCISTFAQRHLWHLLSLFVHPLTQS